MISTKEYHYPGFDMIHCLCVEEHIRHWIPRSGEYVKNLFCSYILQGKMEERTLDGELVSTVEAGQFINHDVTLPYATDETVFPGTEWLCFSSYKPLTAVMGNIIPANTIAYWIDKLCYIHPMATENHVEGKVIIIKHGDFVNLPEIHR